MATEQNAAMQLTRSDMTQVMGNSEKAQAVDDNDIPVSDITGISGGSDFARAEMYPMIFPNSPVFTVPANPLLPEEYSEMLDYNSLQYLNGIYRTQIGRYVRVQQLVGSDTIEEHAGFLIGVGINYIILQENANNNIRIIDIYGIKNMYVYYTEVTDPYNASL